MVGLGVKTLVIHFLKIFSTFFKGRTRAFLSAIWQASYFFIWKQSILSYKHVAYLILWAIVSK